MDETEMVLDGNAAAGMLSEVFVVEATSVLVTCAVCGASGAVGEMRVYAKAPGTIVRCPACTAVMMRFVRSPDRLVADLRGVRAFSF